MSSFDRMKIAEYPVEPLLGSRGTTSVLISALSFDPRPCITQCDSFVQIGSAVEYMNTPSSLAKSWRQQVKNDIVSIDIYNRATLWFECTFIPAVPRHTLIRSLVSHTLF